MPSISLPAGVPRVELEGPREERRELTVDLQPGETRTLAVPLDFFDLEEQAHGYLRAWLRLYDDSDRARVANEEFVLDIRGNSISTMTVFALLLLLVTDGHPLEIALDKALAIVFNPALTEKTSPRGRHVLMGFEFRWLSVIS